jgi:TnpA family transposase
MDIIFSFCPRQKIKRESLLPSLNDTAYPRLKTSYTQNELEQSFTPSDDEMDIAFGSVNGKAARLGFLILLKTFQRLGYFLMLTEVPEKLIAHVARCLNYSKVPDLSDYDGSGTRPRHLSLIREYLQVKVFDEEAKKALLEATKEAALTKEDPADIINVGIEELLRLRFELPGFPTMLRTAMYARTHVNRHIHSQIVNELGKKGQALIDRLLKVTPEKLKSDWEMIKRDPGKPTVNNLRQLLTQMEWLKSWYLDLKALRDLPDAKLRNFAAEAKSLDAARMQEMEPNKRYALAATLIKTQVSRRFDDLGDILVKRIQGTHNKGKQALQDYRIKHQSEVDYLIGKFHDVLLALRDTEPPERLNAVEKAAGSDKANSIERCEEYTAYAGDNYSPFLWRFHKGHRTLLFRVLANIDLASTSTDKGTEALIQFIIEHRTSRADRISVTGLDLSWVSDKWWKTLCPKEHRSRDQVDRRHFEVCVFSHIVHELKSGDLCIKSSDRFADYSQQLISWEEFERTAGTYCKQAGLELDADKFISKLLLELTTTAEKVDREFPDNESIRIENGEPILTKGAKKQTPLQLAKLQKLIEERIEPLSILDIFTDTERWLNWTKPLGPLSGHDSKISNPGPRYVATIFGYGCGLGPSQTAKSLKVLDRRQIAWINQRHVTEELLDRIIVEVINAYNKFELPKAWGAGKTASADGTKWDLYEQNLLSEYHIRYGGYGGLGYYHVSDTYIALFSHFIPCGVWEAVYILDGLLKNESDIQPDTLHADTQGQNTPVFGLAYLLGISLMPRIRNWKDLSLFRPSKDAKYEHIDELFKDSKDPIDWDIISKHWPDLLRVVMSIKMGRVSASSILRKLGTFSRKNSLYKAFSELGKVIRTIFLLKYISDSTLRSTIQAATCKSESFNDLIKWIRFGGDETLKENDRDEQRKLIKYNHLVANLIIFHNVCILTHLLNELEKEGLVFDEETIAAISPYIREHINRFGAYILNLQRKQALASHAVAFKRKKLAMAS